jgi:hypothetical protein
MQTLICPKCGCDKIQRINSNGTGAYTTFTCSTCGLSLKRETTAACRKYWGQSIETHMSYVIRNLTIYENAYIGNFLCQRYSQDEIRKYIENTLHIKIKFVKPELFTGGMIIKEI